MLSASVSNTQIKRPIYSNMLIFAVLQEVFRHRSGLSNFIEFTKMSEHEHFGGLALSDTEVTLLKWQWHLKAQ